MVTIEFSGEKMVLSTLGYQGSSVTSFMKELNQNHIKVLIDVRENPTSRKKGFSKTSLARIANENNIEYLHFKQLGSERGLRKQYRENKNWGWFSKNYNEYLQTNRKELDNLIHIIKEKKCCLMCFEADHNLCHRSLITDFLIEEYDLEVNVNHLCLGE